MLQGLPTHSVSVLNLFYLTPDLLIILQFVVFIIVGIFMCRAVGLIATLLMYTVFIIIFFFCLYVVGSFTAQVGSLNGFLLYIDFLLSKYLPFFMPIVASWGYFFGSIIYSSIRGIFFRASF